MKVQDELLEVVANAYRWVCGKNDVLMIDGRIVTFESVLNDYLEFRRCRGLEG